MRTTSRVVAVLLGCLLAVMGLQAEIQNEQIGFSPNHVFHGVIDGENVDIMTGNVNLRFPLGPYYKLNEWFGYQVQLYYNSRVWKHHCDPSNIFGACPGKLMGSDTYGQGWRISFGEVYRNDDEYPGVFHYRSPSGGDQTFCTETVPNEVSVCSSGQQFDGFANYSFDSSATRFATAANGSILTFTIYPGDGTKLTTLGSIDGPWRVTKVEDLAEPQHWYEIDYVQGEGVPADTIATITDSADRTITFGGSCDQSGQCTRDLEFPAVDGDIASTATYSLEFSDYLDIIDPVEYDDRVSPSTDGHGKRQLTAIALPEVTEKYEFMEYDLYGSLLRWKLPTGAEVEYAYTFYKSSDNRPYHTNMFYRGLTVDGETYDWTYTRFGGALIGGPNDPIAQPGPVRSAAAGSNPSSVRVLDPFGNLTVYRFHRTGYDEGDCSLNCPVQLKDGLLWRVEQYAGAHEDSTKLVQQETYEHANNRAYDGQGEYVSQWFQFKTYANNDWQESVNRTPIGIRTSETEVFTPGGLSHPSSRRRSVSSDWDNLDVVTGDAVFGLRPNPRLIVEYDGALRYRETYTKYSASSDYPSQPLLVEQRDHEGNVVSQTQHQYFGNRLICTVRHKTFDPFPVDLPQDCNTSTGSLGLMPGDVATVAIYDEINPGEVTRKTIGDEGTEEYESEYEYLNGVVELAYYSGLATSWYAVDRDIDPKTGTVLASRGSDGIQTTYQWDRLGRLTEIDPDSYEVPTEIAYPTLRETEVKQVTSSGVVESTYEYDELGRVICETRKNIEDTWDFRKREYDISGRVTRESSWQTATTRSIACETDNSTIADWTTFDYEVFITVDPVTQEVTSYTDPLGRVSKVTRPDGATVETEYEGLVTTVTVAGISGRDPATGTPITLDATTVYENDAFGRLKFVDSPGDGVDATYRYDTRDNLVEVSLEHGGPVQVRRFFYDELGRLESATHPENGTVEYLDYDARGKLLEYRDAVGNEFVQQWDNAGRLSTRKVRLLGAGPEELLVDNTYDSGTGAGGRGKLTKQESYEIEGAGTVLVSTMEYGYGDGSNSACSQTLSSVDAYVGLNGRPSWTSTTIEPWGKSLVSDYCYDELGNLYSTAYPDYSGSGRSRTTTSQTFVNGHLWGVQDLGRDVEYLSQLKYDSTGAIREFTRGNGVRTTIGRDEQGRPTNFSVEVPDNPPNPVDRENLATMFGCSGQGPFGHCDDRWGASYLSTWQTGTYGYDGAGNINAIGLGDSNAAVQSAYFYDELGRLTHADLSPKLPAEPVVMNYEYDEFGNMTFRSRRTGSTQYIYREYEYDVDPATNRLEDVTYDLYGVPINLVTPIHEVSDAQYDGNGNLVHDGSQDYLFDAQNRLQKALDDSGEELGEYNYDSNGYRVRAVVDGVETFYVRDGQGGLLSEFQRSAGSTDDAVWNRDYVYALGQTINVVKNEAPPPVSQPRIVSIFPASNPVLITVEWDVVEHLSDISEYVVTRTSNNPWSSGPTVYHVTPPVGSSTGSVADNISQSYGTAFTYTVHAVDTAANAGPESSSISVAPFGLAAPAYPAGFAVRVEGSDDRVVVTWDEITEFDYEGCIVERKVVLDPDTEPWVTLANDFAGTAYVDHDVDNGVTYQYRIIAFDTTGNHSDPSPASPQVTPQDSVAPARPMGVAGMARFAAGGSLVRWLPALEPDVAEYKVYQSMVPGQTGTLEQTVTTEVTTIAGLNESAWYYYQVSAVDTSGNESELSDQVAVLTRTSSITKPTLSALSTTVDEGGSPVGTIPEINDSCEISVEDDDRVGVELNWSAVGGIDHYRVYRADRTGVSGPSNIKKLLYTKIAEVADSETTYHDAGLNHFDYAYYVVGADSSGNESAASAFKLSSGSWDPTSSVRTLIAFDGRGDYATHNANSRKVTLSWSKVVAPEVAGYHVYRRCDWDSCEDEAGLNPSPRHFECHNSWVRLTTIPAGEPRTFSDTTTGGLNGCYQYAVRPVGPDHAEGELQKVLTVDAYDYAENPPDVCEGVHCHCKEDVNTRKFDTKEPIDTSEEITRINGVARGTGSSSGSPATPTGVAMTYSQEDHPRAPDYGRHLRVFTVTWDANTESDLAGYHVERAGSHVGPWERLTKRPVAWWETRYELRGAAYEHDGAYIGMSWDCSYFRVIAVDEEGRESIPGEPLYDPNDGCETDATLDPPHDVVAVTATVGDPAQGADLSATDLIANGSACGIKLEWTEVDDAVKYNVYRYGFILESINFYRTQQVIAANDCDSQPGACCEAGVCKFVDAGDANPSGYNEDPDLDCPVYSETGRCSINYLQAYYLTSVDSDGVESPKSDLVFWHCDDDPLGPPEGYVRKFEKRQEPRELDPWHYAISPWVADLDEPALQESVLGPDEGITCLSAGSSAGGVYSGDLVAGFATLGTNDPPYEILDLHVDHLGSTRLSTDDFGQIAAAHDYLPFSEEISPQLDLWNKKMFTGHERDESTGLDYMLARYYSWDIAKFVSPDPTLRGANRRIPQAWNRYSYAANNPVNFMDANGFQAAHAQKWMRQTQYEWLRGNNLTPDKSFDLQWQKTISPAGGNPASWRAGQGLDNSDSLTNIMDGMSRGAGMALATGVALAPLEKLDAYGILETWVGIRAGELVNGGMKASRATGVAAASVLADLDTAGGKELAKDLGGAAMMALGASAINGGAPPDGVVAEINSVTEQTGVTAQIVVEENAETGEKTKLLELSETDADGETTVRRMKLN